MARKPSGGKLKKEKKRRKAQRRGKPRKVKLGKEIKKTLKTLGGNKKQVLFASDKIHLITKDRKTKVVKIKNVLEVPSNRFLARANMMTRGAIVETELGKAKITNRPSQEGNIQGILVEEKSVKK